MTTSLSRNLSKVTRNVCGTGGGGRGGGGEKVVMEVEGRSGLVGLVG
jgi:hypothetical protein